MRGRGAAGAVDRPDVAVAVGQKAVVAEIGRNHEERECGESQRGSGRDPKTVTNAIHTFSYVYV